MPFDIKRVLSRITVNNQGCWEWKSPLHDGGYATMSVDDKSQYIHRLIYEYYHGQIQSDLQIDHLCRNRKCVNPIHLELVTQKENIMRGKGVGVLNSLKTQCPKGHPYTKENLIMYKDGSKKCRICHNERQKQYQRKLKEENYLAV